MGVYHLHEEDGYLFISKLGDPNRKIMVCRLGDGITFDSVSIKLNYSEHRAVLKQKRRERIEMC